MDDNETTNLGDEAEAELQAQADAEAAEAEAADKQAGAPKKSTRRRASPKKGPKPGYVSIELAENDEIPPSGLFIGVNDRSYLLQPGMPADVPKGVIDVLDNAVMATPRIDPQTKRVVGYKERLRYPYRRL